jgi:hypothetical protein
VVRDSSVDIPTRFGMDGLGDRIPVNARISLPVQASFEANPAFYTMVTGSFPVVKQPERGADHPPESSEEL